MSTAAELSAIRSAAGLFRFPERGVLEVTGGDRVRWLDGMVTNDVRQLEKDGSGAGCYALLLTAQGRIVADVHLLLRADAIWLETERAAIPQAIQHLERYLVADDVTLADRSDAWCRLGVEGPAAPRILAALLGSQPPPRPHGWSELRLGGLPVVVATFALAGGDGFQLLAPAHGESAAAAALERLGADLGLRAADASTLEVLRIEAGVPRLGLDLDESVLPDEAGLAHAISTTKGCYTGQEVVARMRTQGQPSHRLVGLRCAGESPPSPGASVCVAGKTVGEVTSSVRSPAAGPIALAYLRRPFERPGTEVELEGSAARVVALPFVPQPGSG